MNQQLEQENTNDSWRGAKVLSQFQPQWRIRVKQRHCQGRSKPPRTGLIAPLLVGPAAQHRRNGRVGRNRSQQPARSSMCRTATRQQTKLSSLFREGKAEILMKGSLHTDELMAAIVSREGGLRTGTPHQPRVHHGRSDLSQGADCY